jgi:hypothetical protein
MKKIAFIIGMFLPWLVNGQVGDYFLKMPNKYEAPYMGMNTSVSDESGEKVWYVMAAKNNIPVYSEQECINEKTTERFLQIFAVWKETEDAVCLVKREGDYPLIDGYTFGSGAIEVGWVKKQDLVLWERCLSTRNILIKAILKKNPGTQNLSVNMPGYKGKIEANAFGAFNVLKTEPDAWLLCVTDIVREGFTNDDIFWVEKSSISVISSSRAYVPNWKKVEEGRKLYTFADRRKMSNTDTARAATKIYKNNPYLGFFCVSEDQNAIKVVNPLATVIDTQYINTAEAGFQKAIFIDNNQFTFIKDFSRILKNSATKEALKFALIYYFADRKIDTTDNKIRAMNVSEMLGYTLGIDFSGSASGMATLVDDIKDIDIESYNAKFELNSERLLSERELSKYRMFSGIAYYWLPQELLSLDILSQITLFEPRSGRVQVSNFKEYNIFYIDHSAPSTLKSYDQLQAEIKRLYRNLNMIWSAEAQSNDIGHKIYYSSGFDPVITDGETGFEQVTNQMRNSSTIQPDRFFDKLRLENTLLRDINVVSGKVTIHFDVSQNFYRSEIDGRAYLLKEFVERVSTNLSNKDTRILVYLYCNDSLDPSVETLIQTFLDKMNNQSQNIKYEIYKI